MQVFLCRLVQAARGMLVCSQAPRRPELFPERIRHRASEGGFVQRPPTAQPWLLQRPSHDGSALDARTSWYNLGLRKPRTWPCTLTPDFHTSRLPCFYPNDSAANHQCSYDSAFIAASTALDASRHVEPRKLRFQWRRSRQASIVDEVQSPPNSRISLGRDT